MVTNVRKDHEYHSKYKVNNFTICYKSIERKQLKLNFDNIWVFFTICSKCIINKKHLQYIGLFTIYSHYDFSCIWVFSGYIMTKCQEKD